MNLIKYDLIFMPHLFSRQIYFILFLKYYPDHNVNNLIKASYGHLVNSREHIWQFGSLISEQQLDADDDHIC